MGTKRQYEIALADIEWEDGKVWRKTILAKDDKDAICQARVWLSKVAKCGAPVCGALVYLNGKWKFF